MCCKIIDYIIYIIILQINNHSDALQPVVTALYIYTILCWVVFLISQDVRCKDTPGDHLKQYIHTVLICVVCIGDLHLLQELSMESIWLKTLLQTYCSFTYCSCWLYYKLLLLILKQIKEKIYTT